MASTSAEKTEAARNVVTERVVEAARHAEQVAQEARRLTERAAEGLEDRLHVARRSFKRRMYELENLRDEAASRVRRNPMAAIGATFAAGLVLGIVIGVSGQRRH